jgi:hypothetical protein
LTGPVILGTFRTFEGFAVIKSELIDRISVQNQHLYRQDVEKVAGTDESARVAREWIAKNAANLGAAPPAIAEGTIILHVK